MLGHRGHSCAKAWMHAPAEVPHKALMPLAHSAATQRQAAEPHPVFAGGLHSVSIQSDDGAIWQAGGLALLQLLAVGKGCRRAGACSGLLGWLGGQKTGPFSAEQAVQAAGQWCIPATQLADSSWAALLSCMCFQQASAYTEAAIGQQQRLTLHVGCVAVLGIQDEPNLQPRWPATQVAHACLQAVGLLTYLCKASNHSYGVRSCIQLVSLVRKDGRCGVGVAMKVCRQRAAEAST